MSISKCVKNDELLLSSVNRYHSYPLESESAEGLHIPRVRIQRYRTVFFGVFFGGFLGAILPRRWRQKVHRTAGADLNRLGNRHLRQLKFPGKGKKALRNPKDSLFHVSLLAL